MKLLYYTVFLALVAAARPGRAQQVPTPTADTTGREEFVLGVRADRYYFGTLTKADGTEIQAYLPTRYMGYERSIDYFVPPLSISNELRHRHSLKAKEIKSVAVHGRLFETIQLAGKPTDIVALHLLDGPIGLATYAEPRAIPVPIPLVAVTPILGIPISDKNHWYLRRNGVWTEIVRANFAEKMSAYLADNPALAGKVARQEANYLHLNTPAIIAEYNQAKAGGQ